MPTYMMRIAHTNLGNAGRVGDVGVGDAGEHGTPASSQRISRRPIRFSSVSKLKLAQVLQIISDRGSLQVGCALVCTQPSKALGVGF